MYRQYIKKTLNYLIWTNTSSFQLISAKEDTPLKELTKSQIIEDFKMISHPKRVENKAQDQ